MVLEVLDPGRQRRQARTLTSSRVAGGCSDVGANATNTLVGWLQVSPSGGTPQ